MKIKNILKTCALTLTAFLGVCSLASCKIDSEKNENEKNEQTEQVAEGVHGSKVEVEILLKVGDNKSTSYTCNITRDKNKTKLSSYLTNIITNEIRDFYGITLKEDKLYQMISKEYNKIEAEFDNMVLVEKIGVWADCEYNNSMFAKEAVKAFENEITYFEDSDNELYSLDENIVTGKIIDDLFKQYAVTEGKNLGSFTEVNACWDKTNNTIKGNISTTEEYTTSTTITYENLISKIYEVIEYDKVFTDANIRDNFKVLKAGERGMLSQFVMEITIDNKTYTYEFKNMLHTKLEVEITDNTTNTSVTYKLQF